METITAREFVLLFFPVLWSFASWGLITYIFIKMNKKHEESNKLKEKK